MWLILLGFAVTLFYLWIKRHYSFWERKGVPGPKPLPIFGNFAKTLFGKQTAAELLNDIYKEYEGYPFVGLYRTTVPILMIRDTDFIKNILVKDFKHFHDNDIEVDVEVDPIFGRNPFVMKGTSWKQKRAQLTSCFTSGKIKGMYQFLDKTSKKLLQFIDDKIKTSNCLEARDLCLRFALENVAACAFGLEGGAFEKKDSEFKILANNFLSPDGFHNKIIGICFVLFPKLLKYFKIKLVPQDVEDRLFELVRGSLKYRKDNNIVRNDFLDAVSNLPTENGLFTDTDIVAHAASFFGDGYETSSRVMSFLLFELASNPDAQDKLRDEINEAVRKNNNEFSYEIIHDMPYLDACLNESQRTQNVVNYLSKQCTEEYTYTPTNSEYKKISVTLKPGDIIALPSVSFQMDPKYFDEPEKFIPERFLTKENINKFAHFPFGEGPRACLGIRFAQTQIKTGVAYLIKHFKFSVSSRTTVPLKLDPYYIMRHVPDGIWLDINRI